MGWVSIWREGGDKIGDETGVSRKSWGENSLGSCSGRRLQPRHAVIMQERAWRHRRKTNADHDDSAHLSHLGDVPQNAPVGADFDSSNRPPPPGMSVSSESERLVNVVLQIQKLVKRFLLTNVV